MLEMLQYPIIQHALLVGVLVAVIAALMGYFLLVRSLTFAAHALPNIGFAGAAGAVLLGLDPVLGLLAFTIGAGVGIGLLGNRVHERDTAIGVVMTFALGLGLLFLSLYTGYAERVYSILFGQVIGISQQDVLITAIASPGTVLAMLLLFRPLLFSSFDSEMARARGVPVRLLSLVFLILLALTISLAVQVVGALLIFTLLIGPAATATRLTSRPGWALVLACLLAVSITVLGILLAVANGVWPVSFFITTLSFGVYLPVRLLSPLISRHRRRGKHSTGSSAVRHTEPPGASEPECLAASTR
ncbi:MAG TPA: metal ABC transporter permease [Ktedonobacteraceae bacterium]|jgi:zinc/manganese transport system permease protein